MATPVTLDELDRRIITALQLNARASFGAIADALSEQERTVARRVDRMVDVAGLRFTAFVDELRTLTGQPVSLRIGVLPGLTDHVARHLADRDDVRAVMAVTGDADICCELVAADAAQLHRTITAELPAVEGVRSTRTYPVLRHVKSSADWRLSALTDDQEQALAPAVARERNDDLNATDYAVITHLRSNSRISHTELASRLGVSTSTARRRLDHALAHDAVSLRTTIDPAMVGFPVQAFVWLDVRPDAVQSVATAMGERSEVLYCGVIAGVYALELIVALPTLDSLHSFSREAVGADSTIRRIEPALILHTYKRGWQLTGTR